LRFSRRIRIRTACGYSFNLSISRYSKSWKSGRGEIELQRRSGQNVACRQATAAISYQPSAIGIYSCRRGAGSQIRVPRLFAQYFSPLIFAVPDFRGFEIVTRKIATHLRLDAKSRLEVFKAMRGKVRPCALRVAMAFVMGDWVRLQEMVLSFAEIYHLLQSYHINSCREINSIEQLRT
jgi:hypothetical protein